MGYGSCFNSVVAGTIILAVGSAFSQSERSNTIVGVKAVDGGKSYEVVVSSSEPFIRSDLPVLRIGNQEITISRAPDDGSSDRRIFILSSEQFRQVKSGDKVVFQWGRGASGKQLEFGAFP